MSDYDIDGGYEPGEYKGPWCVAVFLCDHAYGGPEEGGWWYSCGEVVTPDGKDIPFPKWYDVEGLAMGCRDIMQAHLDKGINVGRREISSVLSEGTYRAIICEGYPKHYPETRPHYE
jgi:hypothetical protein